MFDGGIVGLADLFGEICYHLSQFFFFTQNYEVVTGVTLFEALLTTGIVTIVTLTITQWILNFVN